MSLYEIFGYSKAIIRPVPEYIKIIGDHFKRRANTDRLEQNPGFFKLFSAYFRHPIKITENLYLGNVLNCSNYEQLKQYKIDTI